MPHLTRLFLTLLFAISLAPVLTAQEPSAPAPSAWEAARKNIGSLWNHQVINFTAKENGNTEHISITLGGIIIAILFLIFGYLIASRLLSKVQTTLVRRKLLQETHASTLRTWAMVAVTVGLAISTLSLLHIPLTVFAFLGGALAIGLGFGSQNLIKNFISGIIILVERKIEVGDVLEVDGVTGTVTEINTRASIVKNFNDVETLVPNSLFLENRVTNYMLSNSKVRKEIAVGVAYGSSPQQVIEILLECAHRHGVVCKNPEPFAIFEDFGDSALLFRLYYWVDLAGSGSALVASSDLRIMIDKRFGEEGITFPFPQRDVHLYTHP